MALIAELIPPKIREQIDQKPETINEIISSMRKLIGSGEWQILDQCMAYYREVIIGKIKTESNPEWIQKLIAVDLIQTLPKDIIESVMEIARSMSTGEVPGNGFGFVPPLEQTNQ